jgi:predicted enzyme related to lactoylglutathione lyase
MGRRKGNLERKGNDTMPQDGALEYVELPGPDIPATKRFYGSVFGWTFTDYGPDYVAFEIAGRTGGFNAERKVAAVGGGPLVVLFAADLDAMEAKVRAAGAEILSRESFAGGRRFHFRDPNGNEIAVWTTE